MKLTEKQIETIILNHLSVTKGCVFLKLNNTGIYDTKLKKFRTLQNKFTPKGVPDIFGSYYNIAAWIEVKTPTEYAYLVKHYDELRSYMGVTPRKNHFKNQIQFIEHRRKIGDIAFFACSWAMVKEKLEGTQKSVDEYLVIPELSLDRKHVSHNVIVTQDNIHGI